MIIGILKPKGPTSHDMIYRVRKITGVKRVGHAGTLDPAASGVLVIAIGRESTKQLASIVAKDKEYVATVTLGMVSTTDDSEGAITKPAVSTEDGSVLKPTADQVEVVVQQFVGEINQIPPAYSAIKLQGKKAYELARRGVEMELKPRPVVIHSIKVVSYTWPELVIQVHCGKGVYIRSLARDIGKVLGVGGYMSALERTRVGEYEVKNSFTIEAFEIEWKRSQAVGSYFVNNSG